MKKTFLFLTMLFPIATLILSGGAKAADPDKAQYEAALKAYPSDAYYIMTEIDGVKYYVSSSGSLKKCSKFSLPSDGLFTINQVSGGSYATIGWHIEGANGHFANTTLTNYLANLHPGTGVFRLDASNNRNDWESQVFFLNEEGKIAIRTSNTAYGESSWADAGRVFWNYEVDEANIPIYTESGGLMPCYSYEPAYIWTLEPQREFSNPDRSEYEAAIASIQDGFYYLMTEVNSIKYYLTREGGLTDKIKDGGLVSVR